MSNGAGQGFVNEFVIGLGFLSGLWINVGINPETEITNAFRDIIMMFSPDPSLTFLFWLLPIIGTIASIAGAYFLGGPVGLVAVGFAFFGGIFITSSIGAWLLIIGVLLGFFAGATYSH